MLAYLVGFKKSTKLRGEQLGIEEKRSEGMNLNTIQFGSGR